MIFQACRWGVGYNPASCHRKYMPAFENSSYLYLCYIYALEACQSSPPASGYCSFKNTWNFQCVSLRLPLRHQLAWWNPSSKWVRDEGCWQKKPRTALPCLFALCVSRCMKETHPKCWNRKKLLFSCFLVHDVTFDKMYFKIVINNSFTFQTYTEMKMKQVLTDIFYMLFNSSSNF